MSMTNDPRYTGQQPAAPRPRPRGDDISFIPYRVCVY